ncbi:unannotated protein [freshwater metagenome]|uniref:Unannotated protein n=1 Tax=freshwater metagenome TaxID=449393 RepID=A0A6J7KK37_9ZZZZ|nr:hypothetical protein [Actinomycetota bacterium]
MTDVRDTPRGGRPASDDVVLGRYRLVDRVAEAAGTSFWRAYDDRLRRAVGVRFMPLDSPRARILRDAALRASQVTDRRAVPLLDIVEDSPTGQLVIVTEWLVGTPFGDYLASRNGGRLPPREAATLTLEVARFLAAADAAGVEHGRIRPNSVMITDAGEVRVRGLGVDRALYGVEPAGDAALADVHGAGAVLFAGLTGRWPGPEEINRLPGVPTIGQGKVPWPSRVVADVPADLDQITARALRSTSPPKGLSRFGTVAEVATALAATLTEPLRPPAGRRHGRRQRQLVSVTVAVVAIMGLALIGMAMIKGLGGDPLNIARAARPSQTASALPPTSAASTPAGPEIPIVSAVDFDPYGDTKRENPKLVPLAIDAKPETAWTTVRYKAGDLGGKPGVGLLVDLGAPRPVSAVELRLVGNGSDVSLRASDDPTLPPEKFISMAEVTGANSTLTLRVPTAVTTRYLLVWFTQLPPVNGYYQAGIADIRVRG